MKISELAKHTGVSSKTIRYYEEIGLIPAAARSSSGYREYHNIDVERLTFIRRCRELQIPLDQLKKLVEMQIDRSAPCGDVDRVIQDQLCKVRKRQQELAQLEQTLAELARCCRGDRVADCQILHRLSERN